MRLSLGLPAAVTLFSLLSQTQAAGFPYGKQKIRGVALGGWLLVEPFITPSIFKSTGDNKVVDEYTLGKKYGAEGAAQRLKPHWDTFITEADIATIKSYGLNHVRIPIGYWSIIKKLPSEPHAVGAYPYLKKAVGWCKKHGLKVVIDIHGAPGSQNGFDNSGKRGPIEWHKDPVNIQRTMDAFKILINDFIKDPTYRDTVTSIQPLNEPAGFAGADIIAAAKKYYKDSYKALRFPYGNTTEVDTLLSLHDAFQNPADYWKSFMPYDKGKGYKGVALDTHYYSVFSIDQLKWTNQQRIEGICNFTKSMQGELWTYSGEWSVATTDCAGSHTVTPAALGSLYDGTNADAKGQRLGSCTGKTGKASSFSPALKTFFRQYWETQANVYDKGIGWIQWTWKTENGFAEEWSYSKGVEHGWIPKNPNERRYGDLCKMPLPSQKSGLEVKLKVAV